MKYEFEIRGEFEAESPDYANEIYSAIADYFDDVLTQLDAGRVTGKQLAMKGKLQKRPRAPREFIEDDWEIGNVEFYNNAIIVNVSKIKDD